MFHRLYAHAVLNERGGQGGVADLESIAAEFLVGEQSVRRNTIPRSASAGRRVI